MLYHTPGIIIDSGFGETGHGKSVMDGINYTYKRYLSMSMKTVQLTNSVTKNPQMVIHTSTENTDRSLSK